MVHTFFDKNTVGGSVVKSETIKNKELAEKSHKSIIIKFEKLKLHSSFIGNLWAADLADMQIISKFINGLFLWNIKNVLQLLMLFRKY